MWRKNKINREASVVAVVARVNSDSLGYKVALAWGRYKAGPSSNAQQTHGLALYYSPRNIPGSVWSNVCLDSAALCTWTFSWPSPLLSGTKLAAWGSSAVQFSAWGFACSGNWACNSFSSSHLKQKKNESTFTVQSRTPAREAVLWLWNRVSVAEFHSSGPIL